MGEALSLALQSMKVHQIVGRIVYLSGAFDENQR
jgi:hypothetical protein